MKNNVQFIYNIKAFGQCSTELSEQPRKLNHIECLMCGHIPRQKHSANGVLLGAQPKDKKQSSPD
jgi:hypothetical protein